MEESRVMCTNDALINNSTVVQQGDLVPYLPSSVRATLYKTESVCWLRMGCFNLYGKLKQHLDD